MSKAFEDKIAWVTGASSGIGRETALELARQGATVAVSARREDRLAALVETIEHDGGRALAVPCDVTDDADVARAVDTIVSALGRLDVVVANAGMGVTGKFESIADTDWRRQFDVNVHGAASTARHALPHLRASRGRLAFIASVSALVCTPGTAPYSASKFAVRALGLTLAQELAGTGVSVTTIHPGFVASEISQVDNQGVFHPDREDRRPNKLMWPTDKAARVIVRAIRRRKREYVFTFHGKVGAWIGKHMPGLAHVAVTAGRRGRTRAQPPAGEI